MTIRTADELTVQQPEPGPATVLQVLTAGWTWRVHPEDVPPPSGAGRTAPTLDHQVVRAFVWARILIG